MKRVFIKGGTIVNSKECYVGDILIEDEKISKILKSGETVKLDADTKIIDAGGKLVFPGFIDAHTHFDLHVAGTVTCDNFYSGTRAAISGGTTVIIDFGTQYKGETLNEGMDNWLAKAKDGVFCDYGIHMSISDWNEEAKKECQDMMDRGVTTFKIYLTYDILLKDNEAFEVIQRLKEVGAITGVHCENAGLIFAMQQEYVEAGLKNKVSSHYKTRPAAAEAEAIDRILHLAEVAGSDIIDVHLTCKEGLDDANAVSRRALIGPIYCVIASPKTLDRTRWQRKTPPGQATEAVSASSPSFSRQPTNCAATWSPPTISTSHSGSSF